MNLYEGIFLRKSIRSFRMETVETKILENILNFTQHLTMLDGGQQVQFEIIESKEKKKEPQGVFTVKAPYYLVLSALPTEGYMENAGFLMEQVMLYILSKGLGTCFMAYHKMPVKKVDGFEPIVVLAFGKTTKNIYRDHKKAKRLPLKALCSFKTAVGEDIKQMLLAARLAPSSLNNQPWRFVAYENRIHVFVRKGKLMMDSAKKLQKVDVGIALANIYLTAEELWYTCDFVKSDSMKEHEFKNNEYLLTVMLKK